MSFWSLLAALIGLRFFARFVLYFVLGMGLFCIAFFGTKRLIWTRGRGPFSQTFAVLALPAQTITFTHLSNGSPYRSTVFEFPARTYSEGASRKAPEVQFAKFRTGRLKRDGKWSLRSARIVKLASDRQCGFSMKYEYGLRLLGSAREFVASAVTSAEEHGSFNWYPSSEWKFAVVHLATALELLLKARIAIEDPLLLGAKGTVSVADLESGRFRSVTIEVALRRLKQLGLVLTDEQRAALDAVSDLRNRLVHFTIEEDRARFMNVFASGLNLFFELEFSEFRTVESYRAKTQSELIIQLAKVEAFVQERMSSLQPRLESSKRPQTHYFDECHHCLQDATIINDDGLCCLFCRYTIAIPAYAEDASEDGSAEACPDCGRGSMVKRRWRDELPFTSECFCCGHFEGPELGWSDGKQSIPRLHGDRTAC